MALTQKKKKEKKRERQNGECPFLNGERAGCTNARDQRELDLHWPAADEAVAVRKRKAGQSERERVVHVSRFSMRTVPVNLPLQPFRFRKASPEHVGGGGGGCMEGGGGGPLAP